MMSFINIELSVGLFYSLAYPVNHFCLSVLFQKYLADLQPISRNFT